MAKPPLPIYADVRHPDLMTSSLSISTIARPDGSSCKPGAATYVNWADGQPNSFRGSNQDCAMMAFVHWRSTAIDDKGKWDDQSCTVKDNAAVCKILTKPQPPKAVIRGDFKYQFVSAPSEAKNQASAQAECHGIGGTAAQFMSTRVEDC